jgi:hypothetical protein
LNGETPAPKTTVEQIKEKAKSEPKMPEISEDDDDMAYFAKLADEE